MVDPAPSGPASLEDRLVVITGGSSGIGLALARMAAARGARLLLIGRSPDKLDAASREFGSRALTAALDVTDEAAVASFFRGVPKVDHLVTAAAGTLRGAFPELDTGAARALFEGKFWGQHHCVRHLASRLAPGGSVTLFSGWVSRKPAPGMSTLAAVDGAVEALARSLARELAPVRVNAIAPGMVDTPLWRTRLSEADARAHFDGVGPDHAVGRAGTAEDIAHAVLFLIENGFTTGAVLDVDGGIR